MHCKKLIWITTAAMLFALFNTGCADINEQAAGTEKSEAAAEVDTARKNDELFKTFTEKVNGKFTYSDDQITRDEATGEITVTAVGYTLSVDEGAFEIEKGPGGSDKEIGELLVYSATALDSGVQPTDITKAYEELKTTDGSKTVGNVTICSRSGENENSRHYTVSQAGKSQTAEADKNKEEKVKTAADTKKQQDQTAATDDKKDAEEKDTKTSDTNDEKETASTSRNNTSNNTQSNSQGAAQNNTQASQPAPQQNTPAAQPSQPVHEHSWVWVPTYRTEHQPETGHYESNDVWVTDQPAWDEPVTADYLECSQCGWQTSDTRGTSIDIHILNEHNGEASYWVKPAPTGEYIHHEATGHYESNSVWVVDQPARDITVESGGYYQCSTCGATK